MLVALPADVLMAPGSRRENTDVSRLPDVVSDKLDLAARGCTESRCGHTADKYVLEDTVGTICTQHFPSQNSSGLHIVPRASWMGSTFSIQPVLCFCHQCLVTLSEDCVSTVLHRVNSLFSNKAPVC